MIHVRVRKTEGVIAVKRICELRCGQSGDVEMRILCGVSHLL